MAAIAGIPTAKEEILKMGEMDPELTQLLKSSPELANFQAIAGTPEEMRSNMQAQMAKGKDALALLVKDINVKDTKIKTRDGFEMWVRIFTPKAPKEGGSPLAVMYHGGGFVLGDPVAETVNCALMCDKLGFVCVSVDYRLAPEHPFPTAPNDCWDALQWAAENAESLGANPSAGFIAGGTSAGANLAAVVTYLARDKPLSPPLTGTFLAVPFVLPDKAVPSEWGPYYLAMKQNAKAPILNEDAVDLFIRLYQPDVNSPLYGCFNHPKGHKGLPPVYIQVCGMDPLRDDGLIYERMLREEASVKTKIDIYPGMPHAFWAMFPMLSKSAVVPMDSLQGVSWLLQEGKEFAK